MHDAGDVVSGAGQAIEGSVGVPLDPASVVMYSENVLSAGV